MFKRLEYPRICAQLFHASSWRIESVCWSFEVEIKTADLYSLHKQRYCILHLFTCRVLAFSQFLVGTYIKTQTRNLHWGILISLLWLREVDILHVDLMKFLDYIGESKVEISQNFVAFPEYMNFI